MTISILCGGSGSRLWPISRSLMPKQFSNLLGDDSLFKRTLRRNAIFDADFQIITNDKSYFLALDEANAENININYYILESISKNTAMALCIGAMQMVHAKKDDIILAIPSDHLIENLDFYKHSVSEAMKLANEGFIVTFGIKPTSAHTGYGYIQSKENNIVLSFKEKPDSITAQKYLQSGEYFWNSGMFCYRASVLLEEMKKFASDIYEKSKILFKSSIETNKNAPFLRLDSKLSENVPSESIDYALMEKTNKLRIVKAEFEWNDVGSFDSLIEAYQKDENENYGSSTLEVINSDNNLVLSKKLVALIDIHDLIIIDTNDALLIAKRGSSQEVKKIVDSLNKKGSDLTKVHNKAYRPWGSYTVLKEKERFKLKSIVVKPKQRLSLQKHCHRNEHWIVVSGSAIVQIAEKEIFLRANESTYIPMGEVHRLTNPGLIDLILIEVQVGEYLGEDDIVRLEDDYKR